MIVFQPKSQHQWPHRPHDVSQLRLFRLKRTTMDYPILWSLNLSTDSPQQRIPGFWNSESRYDSSLIFIIFHKHTYMSLVLFSGPWWLHLWLRFTKRINVLKNMIPWCCPICLFLEGHPPYSSMCFALKPSFWSGISQRPVVWWHWRITSP